MKKKEKIHNMAACMLSILDYLKLQDNCEPGSEDMLELNEETLSEMMFRKMKAYNIDLNKELGFDHLKPVESTKKSKMTLSQFENVLDYLNRKRDRDAVFELIQEVYFESLYSKRFHDSVIMLNLMVSMNLDKMIYFFVYEISHPFKDNVNLNRLKERFKELNGGFMYGIESETPPSGKVKVIRTLENGEEVEWDCFWNNGWYDYNSMVRIPGVKNWIVD